MQQHLKPKINNFRQITTKETKIVFKMILDLTIQDQVSTTHGATTKGTLDIRLFKIMMPPR